MHKDYEGRLPLCCYVTGLQEGGSHDYYPCRYTEADIIWARRVKIHNERPRNPYTCRKMVLVSGFSDLSGLSDGRQTDTSPGPHSLPYFLRVYGLLGRSFHAQPGVSH